MTDTEIIPYLAEKLFGWEIFPMERQGYSDCDKPRLIQNVAGGWAFFPGPGSDNSVAWNPLLSISDSFQVVEKMRERDKYVRIEIQPSGKSTVMIWRRGVVFFTARDDSPARAICLAVIAALDGK